MRPVRLQGAQADRMRQAHGKKVRLLQGTTGMMPCSSNIAGDPARKPTTPGTKKGMQGCNAFGTAVPNVRRRKMLQ